MLSIPNRVLKTTLFSHSFDTFIFICFIGTIRGLDQIKIEIKLKTYYVLSIIVMQEKEIYIGNPLQYFSKLYCFLNTFLCCLYMFGCIKQRSEEKNSLNKSWERNYGVRFLISAQKYPKNNMQKKNLYAGSTICQ